MPTTTSADGTSIAYDVEGDGPPLILVVGAFNARPTGAPLARQLAQTFTVVNYDRRGRGESTDEQPYAVQREVEDLAALVDEVGGSAAVFGYSSGAVLAMAAAAGGVDITRLALYDPPYQIPGTDEEHWRGMARRIADLVAAGRRGDAVEVYQVDAVGIPIAMVAQFRQAPFWPELEAIAHTLTYDSLVLAIPPAILAAVVVPTLVVYGENSPPAVVGTSLALAEALPQAELRMLPGQTHDLAPDALAPVLAGFLRT